LSLTDWYNIDQKQRLLLTVCNSCTWRHRKHWWSGLYL